jgi:predicted DNA-binding protein (MmcQ/YjbR family)
MRSLAMGYPETREDMPWGHSAFKVKEKSFLFMGTDAGTLSFSVKLPGSRDFALSFPFTEPTHYGLGKSGWVTVSLKTGKELSFDVISAWVDESFRAIAPKKVLALLEGTKEPAAAKRQAVTKAKAPAKKK